MLCVLLVAGMLAGAVGMVQGGMALAQQPIQGNVRQDATMAAQATAPQNVMILLDSSYSMSEKLGNGERKMEAAKRSVIEVVRNLQPTTRVGLRVYGDSDNQFNACAATRTLVPLGENNRMLISSKMLGIRPTGATPISLAITRSLEQDFNMVSGPKTIILISDGIETCGEDPCDVAVRMQRRGIDVKMNVIGLGLSDYAAVKQLRCVALATKGKFYNAKTAAELASSLNNAMAVKTDVRASIITPSAQDGIPPATPTPAPPKPKANDTLLSVPVSNPGQAR